MSFADCDKKIGGGVFFSLKDNGEQAVIVILGEPRPRVSVYQGKERTQAVFPIMTVDGVKVWATGAKVYRNIRDNFIPYSRAALRVVRHGDKGDMNTVYELKPVNKPSWAAKVTAAKIAGEIEEALDAAMSAGTSDNE